MAPHRTVSRWNRRLIRTTGLGAAGAFLLLSAGVEKPAMSEAPGESVNAFTWHSVTRTCRGSRRATSIPVSSGGNIVLPYASPGTCTHTVTWQLYNSYRGRTRTNILRSAARSGQVRTGAGSGGQVLGRPSSRSRMDNRYGRLSFRLPSNLDYPVQITLAVPHGGDWYNSSPTYRTFEMNSPAAAGFSGRSRGSGATFGWTTDITNSTQGNLGQPIYSRLGRAEDAIGGHSIREIVTDRNVRVRPDSLGCPVCHSSVTQRGGWGGADGATRDSFCDKVDAFNDADKPAILKVLFNDWKSRNCPN